LEIFQLKNFENQSIFAEDMIKSQVYCFVLTHSVYMPILL